MNFEEFVIVSSEAHELESLLGETPKENVIERIGLEHRLNEAKARVATFNPELAAKKARLTFRGRPVLGSHGIAADFATKASALFTDAFAAVVAGLTENLRYMGPIPDREKNQLLITGTAIGSFGFEYELPKPEAPVPVEQQSLFPAVRQAELAIEKIEKLFDVAAKGTDDDIAEVVDEIHPRAVKKAAEFLEFLSEQNAWCGLEFEDSYFRFAGIDEVRRSAERLKSNNIVERQETLTGKLEGTLPKGRTFEFLVLPKGEVIKGKVGSAIEDPHVLNRQFLDRLISAKLQVVQVGQGRPRYTLEKLDDLKPGAVI